MIWNDPANFWSFKLRCAIIYTKFLAFQAGLREDQSMIRFWNTETAILNEEIKALVVERHTQGP